jgi:hypothetical protein
MEVQVRADEPFVADLVFACDFSLPLEALVYMQAADNERTTPLGVSTMYRIDDADKFVDLAGRGCSASSRKVSSEHPWRDGEFTVTVWRGNFNDICGSFYMRVRQNTYVLK